MTAEIWAKMTPEQQEAYRQANAPRQQQQQVQPTMTKEIWEKMTPQQQQAYQQQNAQRNQQQQQQQ